MKDEAAEAEEDYASSRPPPPPVVPDLKFKMPLSVLAVGHRMNGRGHCIGCGRGLNS